MMASALGVLTTAMTTAGHWRQLSADSAIAAAGCGRDGRERSSVACAGRP